MTLRSDIEEAAFWEGRVCVGCLETYESLEPTCPDCGGPLIEAAGVVRLLESIEGEKED